MIPKLPKDFVIPAAVLKVWDREKSLRPAHEWRMMIRIHKVRMALGKSLSDPPYSTHPHHQIFP